MLLRRSSTSAKLLCQWRCLNTLFGQNKRRRNVKRHCGIIIRCFSENSKSVSSLDQAGSTILNPTEKDELDKILSKATTTENLVKTASQAEKPSTESAALQHGYGVFSRILSSILPSHMVSADKDAK